MLSRFGSIRFNIRMLSEYEVCLNSGWTASIGECSTIAKGQKVPHRRGLNGQLLSLAPATLPSSLESM